MSESTGTTTNPSGTQGEMDPNVAKPLTDADYAQTPVVDSDSPSTSPDSAAPQEKPQVTPQSQQQQTPQRPVPGKQPDLSKAPQAAPPAAAPVKPVPQAVQKASVFHDIAETLAGGPRYTYNVDEYGNMQRTKVPVSNGHLALAIAMEAISGGITGMAQQGPNAEAKAAAAAEEKSRQQVLQQDQQQRQMAQEDFSRRAQVTEMNMRLYNNARQLGKMDAEQNDAYIGQYKDLVDKLQKELPGYIRGVAKYSDFGKYNVTMDSAIPYKRVPRIGDDGKQVERNGVPQWDIDYLIVDPSFKTSQLLSDDDRKALSEMNESWADNNMIGSIPLTGVMALNQKSRIGQWRLAGTQFGHFADTINEATDKNGIPNAVPTKDVQLPKEANDLAETAAKNNGVDPKYIKAIIAQESSGNQGATSPTGVKGLMQLTQTNAQKYGVNRDDAAGNVEGGTKLFKDLLDKYRDPKLAFAAYYSGDGAIKDGKIVDTKEHSAADTTRYMNQVADRLGLQEQEGEGKGAEKFSVPNMADWTKNHPTFPADVEKFNGALSETDGDYGKALQHLRSSGQADAANNISAFLGGADRIKQHDDYVLAQAEQRKEDVKNATKLDYDQKKKAAEEAGIIQRNQTLIDAIAKGKNIDLSRIATMRAYDREIIVNEILKRNPDFNPASIDRAIKLADEAADESKTGSIGNSIANVNTAYGHMGEAVDHIKNLAQSEGRNFADYANKPMSWMDDHFGSNPEYQQWKVSLQAAATDWQNLLNNQHALTDHDKQVAATVANPNATFANAMASLQEMARTAAVRTLPLNQRWQQTMHTNHPNLIQPQTIEALKKIGDPVTINYLKDLESGGTLVNGATGVGEKGQRVGDLLGAGRQQQAPSQFKPNDASQYKQISRDGKIGLINGQKYDIATGQPIAGQQVVQR